MSITPQRMSIYYIDGEEMKSFIASGQRQAAGIAYEWEGEGVTHLRFAPLRHAFGRCRTVSFALDGAGHDESADIKVDISSGGTATVEGAAAEIIPPKESMYKRAKGLL